MTLACVAALALTGVSCEKEIAFYENEEQAVENGVTGDNEPDVPVVPDNPDTPDPNVPDPNDPVNPDPGSELSNTFDLWEEEEIED